MGRKIRGCGKITLNHPIWPDRALFSRPREAEARGGGTDITDMARTDFDLAQEVLPFLVDFLDLVP